MDLPGQQLLRSLSNKAEDPQKGYEVDNTELVFQLLELCEDTGQTVSRDHVVIWHTHPSGHIGPSREDLATKVPGLRYLVVALPNGEATQF